MKDPAFLFYPADFLGGVSDLTMEERGQYITLLCVQHQKGFINTKRVGLILGFEWVSLSEELRSKFIVDENGCARNIRLHEEIEKRNKFIDKQRDNGKKGGRPKTQNKTQTKPKEKPDGNPNKSLLGDENRDVNIDCITEGGMGETVGALEVRDLFGDVVGEWLNYKRERRESYKSAKSERLFEKQLREMSGDDPAAARKIVEQSIANNWAGIFPLKTNCHDKGKNNSPATQNDDDELMRHIAAGARRGREERERRALRDQQLR